MTRRPSSAYCSLVIRLVIGVLSTGVAAGAAGPAARSGAAVPSPAAYSPHSAWLKEATSPSFGWLVNSARHVVGASQHVLDEAVQRLLGPDLDEDSRARRVERLQPFTNWTGDATWRPSKSIIAVDVGVGRIELARHVGHDRQLRGVHVEPAQHVFRRLARRRDDRGVEGVADRDPRRR